MAVSGLLLVYTAAVVPVQIGFFRPVSECQFFPTIFWDVVVDSFFVVRSRPRVEGRGGYVEGRVVEGPGHPAQTIIPSQDSPQPHPPLAQRTAS